MAVIEDKYIETEGGIRKNIDKDSMPLALDILQRGLYAFPIPSTIRELASNSYDAIKERDVALAIIKGETSVEDHFDVNKQDGIYHSSGWDPSYFDEAWLSKDPCVHIYYEEGSAKDVLRIVDNGVGLGQKRLVGYFQLNYSSKRANKDALGKWGLGSKVALSLNVDSFRVINRYNGKRTKFDVYLDKVDPIIPRFSDNKENGSIHLTDTCTAYYEETTEMNGLEIQIDIKKHNKKLLFEAMQSQLMYMPDIKVYTRAQGAMTYTMMDIRAKELYRDDDIIISESTVYDRPHILIGAGKALINYGLIAFNELEIEPKRGSVGLIMDINDIEVTPSREAPVWSTKTRKAVLEKYNKVTKTAALFVNQSLASETDYIDWMVKADQTMSALKHGSNSSVIGRLASIIDASSITNVTYPLNSQVEFSHKVNEMLGTKLTARTIRYDRYSRKIERKAIESPGALSKIVYFTDGAADPMKDRYIFDTQGEFILIAGKEDYKSDFFAKLVLSSGRLQSYDDVIVPDDILEVYKTAEIEEEETSTDGTTTTVAVDRSAIRKANAMIPVHFIAKNYTSYVFSSKDTYTSDMLSLFDNDEVSVYGTSLDRNDMKEIASFFPHGYIKCFDNWRDNSSKVDQVTNIPHYACFNPNAKPINMIIIAKENVKYVLGSDKYKTIPEFVIKSYDKAKGKLVFSDDIKAAATANVIETMVKEYGLMSILRDEKTEFIFDEDYREFIHLYRGWFENGYDAPQAINRTDFYSQAIAIQLSNSGIVPIDADNLIVELNAMVPECLCDSLDQIKDVDILDIALIKKWQAVFVKIAPFKDLISLFVDKYYNSGSTAKVLVGSQIKDYITLKNDEIV